ncbi:MAG TPA: ribbon-helix-helix protein, CopG family [Gemmatimonadaceae bacterium]
MAKKRYSTKSAHPSAVREPVQVYLDERDRELLEQVAERTGLARAEVLRRALRSLAAETLAERSHGSSLRALAGVLGGDDSTPADLAERHHDYLAQGDEAHGRRSRVD